MIRVLTFLATVLAISNAVRSEDGPRVSQAGAVAACCVQSACSVISELDCATAGGHYLGVDSPLPSATCGSAQDGLDNPCLTGTCCVSAGVCAEDTDAVPPLPMAEQECDALTGAYTGGAQCSEVPLLCPVCPFETASNCQLRDHLVDFTAVMSDLSSIITPTVRADDFVPLGDTITSLCVWGMYLDPTKPGSDLKYDCAADYYDQFRVAVYRNAGGRPGALVDATGAANTVREALPADVCSGGFCDFPQPYAIHLTLFSPITGLVPGETHWLEVSNSGGLGIVGCTWFWIRVGERGKGYSYAGRYSPPNTYKEGGFRTDDLAFCVDVPIAPGRPAQPMGACCTCIEDGGACSATTFEACVAIGGHWDPSATDCAGFSCSTDPPIGDDCLTDVIPISGNGSFNFDTTCSSTDGPVDNSGGPQAPPAIIDRDIWFAYTANYTGTMVASLCGSGVQFDSAISVYHDPANPTECVCPTDNPALQLGPGEDENCTGFRFGGAGVLRRGVFPGECWLIRVGGLTGESGVGTLDVNCYVDECFRLTPTPVAESVLGPDGVSVLSPKNRFLSISVESLSVPLAIQVTFVDLPPPYDIWNGESLWVSNIRAATELPGITDSTPPTFNLGTLSCEFPGLSDLAPFGTVHIAHEGIVPGGTYEVRYAASDIFNQHCLAQPLTMATGLWGDPVGAFDGGIQAWGVADGSVDIVLDAVALLQKFANAPNAPSKVRADLVPAALDFVIDISDIVAVIDAFGGKPYSNTPSVPTLCP